MATMTPAFGGTILRQGSTGPDVALVQRWLNGLHDRWPMLPRLTVDGRFGGKTELAVRRFQLLSGLTEDGEVGRSTWEALCAAYASEHVTGDIYPGIALRSGSSGAAVKQLQQLLQRSVPSLRADGRFGPDTRSAVEAYQLTHGLSADGVVGKKTWDSLHNT